MGWIARRKLASAVCNAGGLGIIETSSGEVKNCIAEIQAMPELTDQPFGVNLPLLFLADDKMVNIVAEFNATCDAMLLIELFRCTEVGVFHKIFL